MKNIFKVALAASAVLIFSLSASAHKGNHDRLQAEKIAFITAELQLTPAEAEKFWPVYNQMAEEKKQAMEAVIEAYKTLDASFTDGSNEAKVKELTAAYLAANKAFQEVDDKYYDKFQSVLPAVKVAKLYIAEEKFRRRQIHNLGGNRGEGSGRPGKNGKPGKNGHPGNGGRPEFQGDAD